MLALCDRVNSGLFCSTPGVAVARSVPKKVALHMLLTAEPLTAEGWLVQHLFATLYFISVIVKK